MRKIADCLEEETFEDNQCIIKQVKQIILKSDHFKCCTKIIIYIYIFFKGTTGDLFFIIRSGNVRITKDNPKGKEEEVARFTKGDYFGEIALIKPRLST